MHQDIVYIAYGINIENIVNRYCENKLKPHLNCYGKCHLKKELQKEDEQNKSLPGIKQLSDVMIFSGIFTSVLFVYPLKEAAFIISNNQKKVIFLHRIFLNSLRHSCFFYFLHKTFFNKAYYITKIDVPYLLYLNQLIHLNNKQ